MANVYGTGEWQGNVLSTGASGAFRYVNIYEATFNQSTGNTVIKYTIGTWVDYGNFYSSTFQSWGTFGDESYSVSDASGNPYGWHQGQATVAYNGSKRFQEGCGYNSSSSGWLESTLDITWKPTLPTYTISYDANNGSGAPSSQSKTWGTDITLRSGTPTRTGYTFKGWATSSTATTATYQPSGNFTTNANTTLYAVWQVNTYTIYYNGNGSTSGSTSSQTKTYNQPLTLRSNGYTRTGYTFTGWNTEANGSGTSYSAGGSYTKNAGATLYAQWSINTWTVSYNGNGSTSGSTSSQTKTYNQTLTLRNNGYSKTGYTFTGWNTAANGSGTSYSAGGSYTSNAAATMYAQWSVNTYQVTYNANGGSGSVSSQTKTYGQALTLASSGFTKSYYTLDGWATSASGSKAYDLGASYTGNAALSLYAHWKINAPNAPSSVSASRNSDSKSTVTWTRGSGADTTYSRIYVERKTDGGSWVSLGYVAGTATSYSDTSITSNHSYQYRVRAYNSTGYSSYASSGTIYTTPAAPQSVSGERTGAGTSVLLTVGNANTNTATGFDVQYKAEGGSWANATVASSTGTPVTSITIDNMGGSYYFRVRNTRSTLTSAWTESALVVTITPPNAPTLISPSSGAVLGGSGSTQSVTFEWQHNPIDGSSQTAAEIHYRKSTATSWTTATATTAQSKAVTLDVGYEYVWSVRTKGAASDYGAYANNQTFKLYAPPSVSVTSPSGTVIGMPIQYELSYLDNYGMFASGTISVKLGTSTKYTENLPATATTQGTASPITGEITTDEFLPSSGNTYTLSVSVRSSDTLTGTATASMPVSMGEPNHGTLTIVNDPDSGYAALTVGWDENTGSVSATYATLYRVTDSGRVVLGDNLASGAGVTDKYAPLNTPYHYEVVTHAASTAIAMEEFDNQIDTLRWFAYWGAENIAWAKWNPAGNYKLDRPDKRRVHYVGREYPVSYDGTSFDETHSITFTVVEYEDWSNNFNQLMRDGGRGVYKSCDGKVFHADFELTNTPNYTSPTRIGEVALTIYRIDGDVL